MVADRPELFEQYSRGELSRRDLERRLGQEMSFADVLLKLYEHGLPLPRRRSDPDSVAVKTLRRLVRKPAHG